MVEPQGTPEQGDSPITDWQMEAWVLDTRPEPHFIIVTPTVEG